MEPNTSCYSSSTAAGTSPAMADQGLPSELDESLLSPPSFIQPPPPPPPGVSVHGHATSQFLPLSSFSFFPDAGALHFTGGDLDGPASV
ncbi:unnamed protein product [Urochloa humidicola]